MVTGKYGDMVSGWRVIVRAFGVLRTANRRTAEFRISNVEVWYRFALPYFNCNTIVIV